MNDPIIKVENLSKRYILNHQQQNARYTALRDVISHGFKKAGRNVRDLFFCPEAATAPQPTEEFFAVKDVSFEIKQGDRVGIIGRNGAGKSTLLKLLSRITEPTTGRIEISGRVASLLEVGTGFHPELTGRENIYLNGAILGMSRLEIKRKFDEIVAFAEVEKFLDTPVKRYSSGMYVRLAFAVAAHLEPEILIVDEVLAVGDVQFQKKCLGKMKDVSEGGRTILFVSHNMEAISNLCQNAILLESGRLAAAGPVNQVLERYLYSSAQDSERKLEWVGTDKRFPLTDILSVRGYSIVDQNDRVADSTLLSSADYRIKIDIEIHQPNPDIRIAYAICPPNGTQLFTSSAQDSGQVHFDKFKRGAATLYAPLPLNLFSSGSYSIELLCLVERCGWILPTGNESRLRFSVFRDIDPNPYAQYRLGGVVSPLSPVLPWSVVER